MEEVEEAIGEAYVRIEDPRDPLGECNTLYAPSLLSSFLVDHEYEVRRGNSSIVDDQLGLVCTRAPPDKGYFSDQGSSDFRRNEGRDLDNSYHGDDVGTRMSSSGVSPTLSP